MAVRVLKFRFSTRTLLVATALLSIAFVFVAKERERHILLAQLRDAGSRIEFANWSYRYPTTASRVKSVCIPGVGYDRVDVRRLTCFPLLERIGVEDNSLAVMGKTYHWETIRFTKSQLHLLLDTMDQSKSRRLAQIATLPEDVRRNPRPLTDPEWELIESATNQPAFLPW